jgi:hypothetical protein
LNLLVLLGGTTSELIFWGLANDGEALASVPLGLVTIRFLTHPLDFIGNNVGQPIFAANYANFTKKCNGQE